MENSLFNGECSRSRVLESEVIQLEEQWWRRTGGIQNRSPHCGTAIIISLNLFNRLIQHPIDIIPYTLQFVIHSRFNNIIIADAQQSYIHWPIVKMEHEFCSTVHFCPYIFENQVLFLYIYLRKEGKVLSEALLEKILNIIFSSTFLITRCVKQK